MHTLQQKQVKIASFNKKLKQSFVFSEPHNAVLYFDHFVEVTGIKPFSFFSY